MSNELDHLSAEDWGRLFPIHLEPYNENWRAQFVAEKKNIECAIGLDAIRIEHFGSTAIQGLVSKPIIDILVQIPQSKLNNKNIVSAMDSIGYHYTLFDDCPDPYMIFVKGYFKHQAGQQLFHIHMGPESNPIWDRLYFRDCLILNPTVAHQYEKLKVELARQFKHDRVGYRVAKTEFVDKITQMAKEQKRD